MTTQEFICDALGCTKAECNFLDTLTEKYFPSFGDWDYDVIRDFNPQYGRLVDYLISNIYDEIITHYVELGLDEDKFDTDINSICSGLIYDGGYVDEQDLEDIVAQLDDTEDEIRESEYITEQGYDYRTGEDKDANERSWK